MPRSNTRKTTKKAVKKKTAKKAVKKTAKKTTKKVSKAAYLTAWVKKHEQGWNHDDWLDLLSQLDKMKIKYVADEVGVYIENKRRQLFGW